MGKFKERWNDMLPYEKVFDVITWVLLCGVLSVYCLYAMDYDVLRILMWLFGLTHACSAVAQWQNRPFSAFISIIFAFISLVLAI